MGLATRGRGFCMDEVVQAEWALARELGIPITVHVAMGRLAGRFAMVKQLNDSGCSGPTPPTSTAATSATRSGSWSRTPAARSRWRRRWSCRWATAGRRCCKSLRMGLRPSLSIDVVTTVPGDMFTQIRAAFGAERARVHAEKYEPNEQVPKDVLTAREVLQAATLDGAHVAGVEDRTGSLTPGKQADIVIIDATSLNMAPVIDPVAAVVLSADVSNVETVFVAGQVKKRDGKLLADVDKARADVEASRDHLLAATAEKRQ